MKSSKNLLTLSSSKTIAYFSLILVVLIWGAFPFITNYFYQFYSPTVTVLYNSIICCFAYFLISRKHLKELNRDYFRIGITTGLFYSSADILQKIGLKYTTPTRYAFLENLSCVAVPILLFLLIRKKPSKLTLFASFLCLVGIFLLNGGMGESQGWGIGEILCAMAGLFYGVNIAVTGIHAKQFRPSLYLMIQMGVSAVMAAISFPLLNLIQTPEGPFEAAMFSFDWKLLLGKTVFTLISSCFCWLIRTAAMRKVSPSAVAVIMPMASAVTVILSLILGVELLTLELVLGCGICVVAAVLSGVADNQEEKA